MTPEERAHRAIGYWKDARGIDNVIPWEDTLKFRIANAITEAVEAERTACAELARAESGGVGRVDDLILPIYPDQYNTAMSIAAAIEARSKEE